MSGIPCFFLEPTDRVARYLRRYKSGEEAPCPGSPGPYSYHHAKVRIEDGPALIDAEHILRTDPMDWPRDDPRWPAKCERCDYAFTDADRWQLFYEQVFRRSDNGEEVTQADAPPDAMWYADWYLPHWQGPDGHCLVVMTPGGEWVIDGPSRDSEGKGGVWTRTGTPPLVTARPSILAGSYHGFLTDGVLTPV